MDHDKKKLLEDSPSFCMMPWVHLYVNTTGEAFPCCTTMYEYPLGNVKTQTIEEIWNSDEMKKLRLNMLNGKKSPTCGRCYEHADTDPKGKLSYRNWANEEYGEFIDLIDQTQEDGHLPVMNLKHFDVRWSNMCNFKCRTCSDMFSSSWAQEAKATWKKDDPNYKIYIKAKDNNNELLDQFKPYLPGMKTVYFAGGEPLIMDEHYKTLEYLIESGSTDMLLWYNSNASNLHYKNKNITEYWKHFKRIKFCASLDSYGERAEYMRHGTVWKDIISNLQTIKKECPHINIGFNCVVGMWNCLTITDLFDNLVEHGIINLSVENTNISLYRQIDPPQQNAKILPLELRSQGIDKIHDWLNRNKPSGPMRAHLLSIVDYLKMPQETDEELRKRIKHYIIDLDTIRNESFTKTFPELREWYEGL